ncbi:MAG: hypothetical protein KKA81_12570 [Bacteroidetes bacterium]|nr:hypothetical protein [Bacteroidota bacterium]
MRSILFIWIFILVCLTGFSQEDNMSVGMRLGVSTGICFNYFEGYHGFEGLLTRRNKGLQLTGIYLAQKPLENKYRLNFWVYYGAGLHVGYVRWKQRIGPYHPAYGSGND